MACRQIVRGAHQRLAALVGRQGTEAGAALILRIAHDQRVIDIDEDITLTLLEQADSSAARLLAALKLDKSEVASEVERGEALELPRTALGRASRNRLHDLEVQ